MPPPITPCAHASNGPAKAVATANAARELPTHSRATLAKVGLYARLAMKNYLFAAGVGAYGHMRGGGAGDATLGELGQRGVGSGVGCHRPAGDTALDGVCDEPDLCPSGTDHTDCVVDTCEYANDGVCDEPDLCTEGTDTTATDDGA